MARVGRPLKFKSKNDLETKIEAFFKYCDKKKKPYTITGLALALDTSRQTLLEYEGEIEGREEKSKEFAYTIKKAKDKCENYAEEMLFKIRATGPIFALKNYGWKDENTTKVILPKPLDDIPENNSLQEDKGFDKED